MDSNRDKPKKGVLSRDPSPELGRNRRARKDKSQSSNSVKQGDSTTGDIAVNCQGQSLGGTAAATAAGVVKSLNGGTNSNGMLEKDKWMTKLEDPLEKQQIRERLRAMPAGKKESEEKQRGRGPMVVRPPSSRAGNSVSRAKAGDGSTQTCKRPTSLRTNRSSSPRQTPDSVFTQQVVCRSGSPTSPLCNRRKTKISPVTSRPASPTFTHRRSPSPQGEITIAIAEEILRKRVERALHARLYLLQQSGPNSFVIGGDSPSHKYKVVIGSQNCNCGKGPFCLHVLFVMLRVFQVGESDPILWSRTLKNYEVETLFRKYEKRQKTRLKHSSLKATREGKKSSHDASGMVTTTDTGCSPATSTASSDQSNKEEDLCPICLLEMVDGESLVVCQDGCRNRLHHHCVAIWAAECDRQSEPLNCPLCRTKWDAPPSDGDDSCTPSGDGSVAPPNTTRPSPAPSPRLMRRAGRQNPEAGEFPAETAPWIQVFSEDVIGPLFSREWSLRETAFHHVRPAIRARLLLCSEGPGYSLADEAAVKAACGILALGCSDPVYKIYVAALKGLRTMLSCIHCFDEADQHRFREELRPVFETILHKCADGNRRTSQLSISALVELGKGQTGELATGRESSASDTLGLGGVEYVEDCIFDMTLSSSPAWQPHLGRLYVLEKLMKEFPEAYGDGTNCNRLMAVLRFALAAVHNSHSRICKLGKRIFVNVARSTVHVASVFEMVCDATAGLPPSSDLRVGLRRRLADIQDNFDASRSLADRLQETDTHIYGRAVGGAEPRCDAATAEGPPGTPPPQTPRQTTRTSGRPSISLKVDGSSSSLRPLQDGETQPPTDTTGDLSDLSLSMSPCSPLDRAITFRGEVAASNGSSSALGHGGSTSCKDKIELEEAEAMAAAVQMSQQPLPVVPGLSPKQDGDIIVHIQKEEDDTSCGKCYVEKEQWVKGVLLGTGAFSSCYQSRDIQTGTLMAVKQVSFFRNNKCAQDKVVESLMREIHLMKDLDHPNIVRLLGATRHNGHYNVFVEWMAGGSVASVLSAYGAFEESVVLKYTHQLLTGVSFLHSKHLIHRDLKGANLLLDSTGHHLRIADFGTAAQMASQVTAEGEFKGQLIGTIAFMSPEVLRGEPYGRSCDVWSVGCCIVEMAMAQPPWNASAISNHLQLIFKIASAEGPPPIPDNLSQPTSDLLFRCFQHKPENRESSADLLKHAVFTQL